MKKKLKLLYLTFIYLLLISSIFINAKLFANSNKNQDLIIMEQPANTDEQLDISSLENNNNLINNYQKKYHNDEVVGIISILNTDYEKAIMQHTDNEYYLNHLENKKSHYMGSIYLDFRINISTDKKILIYGHNSKNINMPFKILENYYDESYYQEHQYIQILTKEKTRLYQIFSIYVETSDFDYMQTDYDNETTWFNHLTKLKNKSFYETNINITPTDNILILQTCSTHNNYQKYQKKYLLIVAKEIN